MVAQLRKRLCVRLLHFRGKLCDHKAEKRNDVNAGSHLAGRNMRRGTAIGHWRGVWWTAEAPTFTQDFEAWWKRRSPAEPATWPSLQRAFPALPASFRSATVRNTSAKLADASMKGHVDVELTWRTATIATWLLWVLPYIPAFEVHC